MKSSAINQSEVRWILHLNAYVDAIKLIKLYRPILQLLFRQKLFPQHVENVIAECISKCAPIYAVRYRQLACTSTFYIVQEER